MKKIELLKKALLCIVTFLFSCQPEKSPWSKKDNRGWTDPVIANVYDYRTAYLASKYYLWNESDFVECGFLISKDINFESDFWYTKGEVSKDSIYLLVNNLEESTTYYVRSYIKTKSGIYYSTTTSFVTHEYIYTGIINELKCSTALHLGEIIIGNSINVISKIAYTGGNRGNYKKQVIHSTGVLGLTMSIDSGTFDNQDDTLVFEITGKTTTTGYASFSLNIGGQNCIIERIVIPPPIGSWRNGMVHCNTSTPVVPVINPSTNKIWMDRNLGADIVMPVGGSVYSYGDLYQWGRFGDGHQCRNSGTTNIPSATDTPGNPYFIITQTDWRITKNTNLWQGVDGINNPCPVGYRIPTDAEFKAEIASWNINNYFASPLKMPLAAYRSLWDGKIQGLGSGRYWTSTLSSIYPQSAKLLAFDYYLQKYAPGIIEDNRGGGSSIRCIQD